MECQQLIRPSSSFAPSTSSATTTCSTPTSSSLAGRRFWDVTPRPSRPDHQITTSKRERRKDDDDADEGYVSRKHTQSTKNDKTNRDPQAIKSSTYGMPEKPPENEVSTSVLASQKDDVNQALKKVETATPIGSKETDQFADKINELEQVISDLEQQKGKLGKALADLDDQYDLDMAAARESDVKLREEITKLKAENGVTKANYEKVQTKSDELRLNIYDLIREHVHHKTEELKSVLDSKDKEISEKNKRISELETKVSQLQEHKDNLIVQSAELKSKKNSSCELCTETFNIATDILIEGQAVEDAYAKVEEKKRAIAEEERKIARMMRESLNKGCELLLRQKRKVDSAEN